MLVAFLQRLAQSLVLGVCLTFSHASTAQVNLDGLLPYLSPQKVQRYALVIHVEDYLEFGKVSNAANDAIVVGNALAKADFEVTTAPELRDKAQLVSFLNDVIKKANPAAGPTVIAIFYAGHGFQSLGFNYIVPKEARRSNIVEDSISIGFILEMVAPVDAGLSIVFLDACRSPVPIAGEGSLGYSRTGAAGDFENTVVGMATKSGRAAASSFQTAKGASKNSPYSAALGIHIPNDGHTLAMLWDSVRDDVKDFTMNTQAPEELNSGSQSRFRFVMTEEVLDRERKEWDRLLRMPSIAFRDLSIFISSFPGGAYNAAALRLRKHLMSLNSPRELK